MELSWARKGPEIFSAMAWPAAKTHAAAFWQFNSQAKIRGAGGTIYCQPNREMTWGKAVRPSFLLSVRVHNRVHLCLIPTF